MKNHILGLGLGLGIALCLMLSACGNQQQAARAFAADDVDTILAAGIFSEELEQVDTELVCALYGVEESLVADSTAYLSTGATSEEAVLFILKDAADVQTVKEACEKRVSSQISAYEDYGPSEVPKLENALIEVREATVLMIVANDAQGAAKVVSDLK